MHNVIRAKVTTGKVNVIKEVNSDEYKKQRINAQLVEPYSFN